MKYYSEKLSKIFDTEEELKEAENKSNVNPWMQEIYEDDDKFIDNKITLEDINRLKEEYEKIDNSLDIFNSFYETACKTNLDLYGEFKEEFENIYQNILDLKDKYTSDKAALYNEYINRVKTFASRNKNYIIKEDDSHVPILLLVKK